MRIRASRWGMLGATAVVTLLIAAACGGGGSGSAGDGNPTFSGGSGGSFAGNAGSGASSGTSTSGGTGGTGAQGGTFSFGGTGGDPNCTPCAADCCSGEEQCLFDQCVETLGPCTTSDQCSDDSYCHMGQCVPFGVPSDKTNDETCARSITIDSIEPQVQCAWTGPPAGDAHPDHVHVMSTPVVVDFDFDDNDQTLEPSIVFTTFPTVGSYTGPGVLRVISGRDCSQQFTFDAAADATMSPAPVALGDIDGDGRAEIVATAHGGGVLAFRYDPGQGQFVRLWRSGTCDGSGGVTPDATGGNNKWGGPSIYDLDDDGSPEIVYGGVIYGADGCIRSQTLGFQSYSVGVVPVVADVDEDGIPELIYGNGIYQWDSGAGDVVAESYFTGVAQPAGFVAVAELGDFPVSTLGNQDYPEIVVVTSGSVRVQTLEGVVVFGPAAIPGGGSGGPPTIADFDGDGRREFASAGGSAYAVFDFDCLAGGDASGCNGMAKTDGVLWQQPSQDQSSNVTGSSVFDFDADGKAEAVYADECFLRIYDGATGVVKYSAARSSGTTYENPVIVDVDGDFNTEIVTAANDYSSIVCPTEDPLLPGVAAGDSHGVVVLRDVQDRWAASRPVWNQHAYSVTNVGERGEIPASSQVARNWDDPALNNFRQNVQGDLEALGILDLTVSGEVNEVQCNGTVATLEAVICNRGTLPMASGTEVAFREGAADGPELCREAFATILAVGECDSIACEADLGGDGIDVYVVVDPENGADECWEGNNVGLFGDFRCGQIPK